MRTTLTINDDVAARLKDIARRKKLPFREVTNATLRSGLDVISQESPAKPYRTKGRPLKLKNGLTYDNIGELLELGEGDDFR